MHTLEQFTYRTSPRNKAEGTMPTESLGLRNATELVARIQPDAMATLAERARTYVPAVRAEVDELSAALATNPRAIARRALLFGLSTPNNDERDSVAWSTAAYPHFGTLSPVELSEIWYPSPVTGTPTRVGIRTELAAGLADIYRDFSDAVPADLTPERLERVRHIGPKVARMITAVANPDARVFTVDLWHARQLLWAADLEYRARVSVSPIAYPMLEQVWLDYRDQYFSDQPTWVCQWATWDAANGRHEPHRQLWADLAA